MVAAKTARGHRPPVAVHSSAFAPEATGGADARFAAALAAQAEGLRALQAEHERAVAELREEGARLREENERLQRQAKRGDDPDLATEASERNTSGFIDIPDQEGCPSCVKEPFPALSAKQLMFDVGEPSLKAPTMVLSLDDLNLSGTSPGTHDRPMVLPAMAAAFPSGGGSEPDVASLQRQSSFSMQTSQSESGGRAGAVDPARRKRRASWVSMMKDKSTTAACAGCGASLTHAAVFCPFCGMRVGASTSEADGRALGTHTQSRPSENMRHSEGESSRLSMLPLWSTPRRVAGTKTRALSHDMVEKWHRMRKFGSTTGTTTLDQKGVRAIRPTSPVRLAWDVATLLFVLYDAIMLPTAFLPYREPEQLEFVAFSLRVFWTLDLPLSFISGFTRKDGSTELSLPKVARHYAQTWMGLDICVVIIDWVVYALDASTQASSAARSVKVLRATRLARMLRMVRVYRLAVLSAKYMPGLRYLTRSMGTRLALEIVKVLLGMILVNHFIACFWHFMATIPNDYTDLEAAADLDNSTGNWLMADEFKNLDVAGTYVVAYHWSMTNFVGQSDINAVTVAERLFSIVMLLFAFLVLIVVPPRITTLMTSYQNANAETTTKYLQLTNYLQDNHISQRLAVRLQRAALSGLRLERSRTPEKNIALLEFVPVELRIELRWEMYSPHLLMHPLLHSLDEALPEITRKIAYNGVQTLELAGDDVLFMAFEEPEAPVMYFVRAGTLSYTHSQGSFNDAEEVPKGGWLAEASLWTTWTYRGDAQACEDTGVLILQSSVFQDIVLASDVLDQAREYGESFLKRLREQDPLDVSDLGCYDEVHEDASTAFADFLSHHAVRLGG